MAVEVQGVQDETPVATKGYGSREGSDDTRQAQQSFSNDTPTDVNLNAVIAREQAGTSLLMGKEFVAASARRNSIFDHVAGLLGIKSVPE